MNGGRALFFGFHLEGCVDAEIEIGIWVPTMGGAFYAFGADDLDRRFFYSHGWKTRDCTLLDVVTQTAPGSHCGFILFLFVGNVDNGFNDGTEFAFGNFIGEGVDDDAARSQGGFVELRIPGSAAAEAGEVPDDETVGSICHGGEAHHVIKLVAVLDRAARFVDVFKWGQGEDEAVRVAIFDDFEALLFNGSILCGSARIAQVGPDCGAWWECRWGRFEAEVGQSSEGQRCRSSEEYLLGEIFAGKVVVVIVELMDISYALRYAIIETLLRNRLK